MALPVAFDTQGFPVVNAIIAGSGGAGVSVVDQTPTAPTHGVPFALVDDASHLIATVQVGKRYRITPIGTEGIVWSNSAGPAARATDEPLQANQKDEFIAVHVSVYAQKLVAGTADGSVNVTPRDGGTIA